jgi:chitinase
MKSPIVAALLLTAITACGGPAATTPHIAPFAARSAPASPKLVGYWAGWETGNLSAAPAGVSTIYAFAGFVHGHTIVRGSIRKGLFTPATIAAMHARGIKVVLSIGGSYPLNAFVFDGNVAGFEQSLKSVLAKTPYDGVDFDDESGTEAQRNANIEKLIPATRAFFNTIGQPNAIVTYAAFDNPDTMNDKKVLARRDVRSALSWVNIMCYEGNAVWKTEQYVSEFGKIYPKSKLMMGTDLDNAPPTTANLLAMSSWLRTNGYGGLMVFTINNAKPKQLRAIEKGLNGG